MSGKDNMSSACSRTQSRASRYSGMGQSRLTTAKMSQNVSVKSFRSNYSGVSNIDYKHEFKRVLE